MLYLQRTLYRGTLHMSTPAPGVLSRRSHRRCMRIRCAPPVDSLSSHAASQEDLLRAEHDAPVHGHGRDQAVPGPADSLEGRQGGRPGQALVFPQLTGAEQNASYTGTPTEKAIIARYMLKYGNVSAPSAAPSPPPRRTHRAPTLPLQLRHPRARPARRPPATPPTHLPPTRSVASTCRCSSAPVFSRTRHTLHE